MWIHRIESVDFSSFFGVALMWITNSSVILYIILPLRRIYIISHTLQHFPGLLNIYFEVYDGMLIVAFRQRRTIHLNKDTQISTYDVSKLKGTDRAFRAMKGVWRQDVSGISQFKSLSASHISVIDTGCHD